MSERAGARSLAVLRAPLIDRAALLDRLGPVEQPPPDVHAWLNRATLPAGLPGLLRLDQASSYALCVRVVVHLTRARKTA